MLGKGGIIVLQTSLVKHAVYSLPGVIEEYFGYILLILGVTFVAYFFIRCVHFIHKF